MRLGGSACLAVEKEVVDQWSSVALQSGQCGVGYAGFGTECFISPLFGTKLRRLQEGHESIR
jgi:hypothetical protein